MHLLSFIMLLQSLSLLLLLLLLLFKSFKVSLVISIDDVDERESAAVCSGLSGLGLSFASLLVDCGGGSFNFLDEFVLRFLNSLNQLIILIDEASGTSSRRFIDFDLVGRLVDFSSVFDSCC